MQDIITMCLFRCFYVQSSVLNVYIKIKPIVADQDLYLVYMSLPGSGNKGSQEKLYASHEGCYNSSKTNHCHGEFHWNFLMVDFFLENIVRKRFFIKTALNVLCFSCNIQFA
mgnify:CR=1 FL=1